MSLGILMGLSVYYGQIVKLLEELLEIGRSLRACLHFFILKNNYQIDINHFINSIDSQHIFMFSPFKLATLSLSPFKFFTILQLDI
ncbi:unnamed protein product [Camellia sinensis]